MKRCGEHSSFDSAHCIPDKTGGEFASNEQKGKFHRLSEALQFLASHAPIPLALVTNAEMSTRTLRLLEQIEPVLGACGLSSIRHPPDSRGASRRRHPRGDRSLSRFVDSIRCLCIDSRVDSDPLAGIV